MKLMTINIAEEVVNVSNGKAFLDINELEYNQVDINPFCVEMISDIKSKILQETFDPDISSKMCTITLADGRIYIVNMSRSNMKRKLEEHIETANLPF